MNRIIQAYRTRLTKFIQQAGAALLGMGFLPAADLTPVTMQLDWIYNAQFAGLYQASEQGYFEEAGLAVEILPVDPKQRTVESVLGGSIAFGSAESNVLLKAHAEGAPVKVLATMFQDSPLGWMYIRGRDIETFADLAGKRIGIHPDGEKVLSLASARAGLKPGDFLLPHVGHDIGILIRGEVDAMQCYAIDEFVKLQLATKGRGGLFMAKDLGYKAYSQVIFTTAGTVATHPGVVRSFLRAVQRGWTYALDHKEKTVDLILRKYNPDLDRAYQLASLEKIEALVRPGGAIPLAPVSSEIFAASMRMY
ncbi:MAG TPA: ABC transporter substrate-binding protein, partial [Oceanipulchritudo sp.]|nr:ABC transporter substrate-binding protein [Oceanipulchritudo sp.]